MIKRTVYYWEVRAKFIVRKGSYNAETKEELKKKIQAGIGGIDMDCIEAEEIEVEIK